MSLSLHSPQKQVLYAGRFPVFQSLDEVMKPVDVLNAILNTAVTSKVVCTQKPVGVKDAAVFLVDTSKLRHPDDLKADDVGSWVHKDIPSRYYSLERSPSGVVYGVKRCGKATKDAIKLTRIYYHHQGTSEFRKTIFYAHGKYVKCVGCWCSRSW